MLALGVQNTTCREWKHLWFPQLLIQSLSRQLGNLVTSSLLQHIHQIKGKNNWKHQEAILQLQRPSRTSCNTNHYFKINYIRDWMYLYILKVGLCPKNVGALTMWWFLDSFTQALCYWYPSIIFCEVYQGPKKLLLGKICTQPAATTFNYDRVYLTAQWNLAIKRISVSRKYLQRMYPASFSPCSREWSAKRQMRLAAIFVSFLSGNVEPNSYIMDWEQI